MQIWRWMGMLVLPMACAAQTPAVPVPPVVYESGIAKLKEQLVLQDAQIPVWTRYVARIDAYSQMFYQERPVASYAEDSGPRQLGRMVDRVQNRLAALEDIESAAKDLYAVLTLEQKSVADKWMVASVPVLPSGDALACRTPAETKTRAEKVEQRGHRGNAGIGAMPSHGDF